MAKGSQMNIRLKVAEMSFKEFGEFCSTPQQGGKHEAYFIRGVPEFEDHYETRNGNVHREGYFRHDSSLKQADFLIIDADHCGASPKSIHDALTKHEYTHFLYTSHSHTDSDNNFRVVIPCRVSDKHFMPATAHAVTNLLREEGCDIEYTREMGVWSQAWYLPTRDDPDDGVFRYYEYLDGTDFIQIEEAIKVESVHEGEVSEDVMSVASMIHTITGGGEGLHHAMKSYSYGQVKDGVNKVVVKETLRGLMDACTNKDKRWQERYDDINRLVDGVEDDEEGIGGELTIPDEVLAEHGHKLDWPPGHMGELARAVYNYSDYPNKTVSIVTALGLVSGIAGRRFNINGAGLNLYITLLMGTGKGKSVIDSFIARVMTDANILSGQDMFTGKRRYTGPKALMEDLSKKRCFVSVFTEAGFMFKSKSGDQSGLTRTILDLYTKSGFGQIMQEEAYSDSKNNIPAVISPCFSMVNESTPEIFLNALKDGTETGEITRMNIFRVRGKGKLNRKKHYTVSGDLLDKIKGLMDRCNKTQHDDDPDISEFTVTDEMWEFTEECDDHERSHEEEDPIKSKMMGRAGLKTWKIASLCSVMNLTGKKSQRHGLAIGAEEWTWAKQLHEYEMAGLEEFFKVEGDDDLYVVVEKYIWPKIRKLLSKEYKERQMQPSRLDLKVGRIPKPMLIRAMRNIKAIRHIDTSRYGKPAVDTVIEFMQREEYVKMKRIDKKQYCYVKQAFIDMMTE